MFTGIITDIGRVHSVVQEGDLRARIQTGYNTARIEIGASIASDGVCLTVVALGPDWYDVQVFCRNRGQDQPWRMGAGQAREP